jgi:hypothetical protein
MIEIFNPQTQKIIMKRFFSVALAAIFTLTIAASAQAAEPFFLSKVGAEAEYALKDASGEITSYTKSVVTALSSNDPQNATITYTAEVFDKDHKSLAAPMSSSITVKDGAVDTTPVMEGVEIEGTLPSYPATLSVGLVMEYSFKMKMMGMNTTTSGKNTVVAQESVTTPAGTFNCYKIESETSSKVMLQNVKAKTTSWIAEGIGTVKAEVYDDKDRLQSTMELVAKK